MFEDGGFKVTSSNAYTARVSAVKVLEWASKDDNAAELQTFAARITSELDKAFDWRGNQSQMWGNFHRIRTSSEFLLQWSSFATSSVGEPISPVLSQHLTSVMFKEMIKQQFPLKTSASVNDDLPPLSVAEQNVL